MQSHCHTPGHAQSKACVVVTKVIQYSGAIEQAGGLLVYCCFCALPAFTSLVEVADSTPTSPPPPPLTPSSCMTDPWWGAGNTAVP